MSEHTQKLLSNSLIAFIGFSLAAVFSYLLRIILARNLSVENIGLYSSVLSFVIFLTLFQKVGTELALVRYINVWKEKGEFANIRKAFLDTFWFQMIIGALYFGVIYFFAGTLARSYFHSPAAKLILLLFSSLLFLLVFEDLPRRVFQGFNNMLWFSFMEAGKAVLILLLVLVGFWYSPSLYVAVFSFLIATFLISMVGFFGVIKNYPFFIRGDSLSGQGAFKEVFSFGLPLVLFVIGNKIIESLDLQMLTYFRSLEEVGIYSMVLPTAGMAIFIYRPLAVVFLPLASELWAKQEQEKLLDVICSVYKYFLILMIPFLVLVILYSSFILSFLFGKVYLPGTLPLQIITAGVFLYGLVHINLSLLTAFGRSSHTGVVILYGTLANFILNLFLIPKYGMVGAAVATLFSYGVTFIFSYYYVRKHFSPFFSRLPLSKLFLALTSFIALSIVLAKIVPSQHSLSMVLLTSILTVLGYIILINKLKLFTVQEFKSLLLALLPGRNKV